MEKIIIQYSYAIIKKWSINQPDFGPTVIAKVDRNLTLLPFGEHYIELINRYSYPHFSVERNKKNLLLCMGNFLETMAGSNSLSNLKF